MDLRTDNGRRSPLNVAFIVSSLGYGGAETLLVNLMRRMRRTVCMPQLGCIKMPGPLGMEIESEIPTFAFGLRTKYDVRVLPWLVKQLRDRRIDAVVTVGAGDKMFWGRIAAWRARVPVIVSALHTTGWPDCVGRLNRMLTRLNDAFVGVAQAHGKHLIHREGFPAEKVHVIPNGVDVDHFRPEPRNEQLRHELGLPPGALVAGIVARLGEEKNHEMFLHVAAAVCQQLVQAHFLIIGDGPRRAHLTALGDSLGLHGRLHFLGTRPDIPQLLSLLNVFLLTSHVEANPVSILEAAACGKPVVATRVGSIPETVIDGRTGYLVPCQDVSAMQQRVLELFTQPDRAAELGALGRQHIVRHWSLGRMVQGYEQLLTELYARKVGAETSKPGLNVRFDTLRPIGESDLVLPLTSKGATGQ